MPQTKSRRGVLLGSQVPTYRFVPRAGKPGAGQEVAELAAAAGLLLDPAQQLVLDGALRERPDGSWASTTVGLVEPRQNGKGGILEARELAGLFLFGEPLIVHTAHRYDTSQEHFRRLLPLVDQIASTVGDRRLRLKRVSHTNGDEGYELACGHRLVFKARTKLGGRGFAGVRCLVLDEAMYLMELGSLIPTASAARAPQIWFVGSSPLARPESAPLRRLCRAGRIAARGGKPLRRACYAEWCAEVGADPGDYERWWAEVQAILADDGRLDVALARANPALGTRLDYEYVTTTERQNMTDEEYARERLGLWPDVVESEETQVAIPAVSWSACLARDSKAVHPVRLFFEVSVDRRWGQIGAAAPSTTGGTHVEIVENRRGTDWVVGRLAELVETHQPAMVLCYPAGPAGALLPECVRRGIGVGIPESVGTASEPAKYRAMTARDLQQAHAGFYDAVVAGSVRHIGQPELDAAVRGATWRGEEARVFDRRGEVDISPLVCVAGAWWAAGLPLPPEPEEMEPWFAFG